MSQKSFCHFYFRQHWQQFSAEIKKKFVYTFLVESNTKTSLSTRKHSAAKKTFFPQEMSGVECLCWISLYNALLVYFLNVWSENENVGYFCWHCISVLLLLVLLTKPLWYSLHDLHDLVIYQWWGKQEWLVQQKGLCL